MGLRLLTDRIRILCKCRAQINWNLEPDSTDSLEVLKVKEFFIKKVIYSEKPGEAGGIFEKDFYTKFMEYQHEVCGSDFQMKQTSFIDIVNAIMNITKSQRKKNMRKGNYWLNHIEVVDEDVPKDKDILIDEGTSISEEDILIDEGIFVYED